MKCSICGRKLRNPNSMTLGCGPVCYRRKFGTKPHICKAPDVPAWERPDYNLPGQISIEEYLQTLSVQ